MRLLAERVHVLGEAMTSKAMTRNTKDAIFTCAGFGHELQTQDGTERLSMVMYPHGFAMGIHNLIDANIVFGTAKPRLAPQRPHRHG